MNTFITLLILLIPGIFIGWITIILLPIVGMIGEGIAGAPEKRSGIRFSLGVWIGALFQSYFYFSFMIMVISWTETRINPENWTKYIIWSVCFLVCLIPIFQGSVTSKSHHEAKQTGYYSAISESMRLCSHLSFIAFFVFLFNPKIMKLLWFWVPYV